MTNAVKTIAKRTFKIALLGAVLTAGYVGCRKLNEVCAIPNRLSEPVKEQYDQGIGLANVSRYPQYVREAIIRDLDGDGIADAIDSFGIIYWIAPGHESSRSKSDMARVMTPEIREAATRSMKESRNLSYLLANEAYRLQEESK